MGVFPPAASVTTLTGRSSPRSWGCFCFGVGKVFFRLVFPTLVGVFPSPSSTAAPRRRSSPRSWGCFQLYGPHGRGWAVFPTLVGVFLLLKNTQARLISLPHARGGVSHHWRYTGKRKQSSPRSWGCFYQIPRSPQPQPVFPTLVGVFLLQRNTQAK